MYNNVEFIKLTILIGFLVSVISLFFIIISYRRYKAHRKATLEAFLNIYIEKYHKEFNNHEINYTDIDNILMNLKRLLTFSVRILSEYTGKRIYTSIKLIRNDDVFTFLRDRMSDFDREVMEFNYPIKENPPYKNNDNYYINNNIIEVREGGYFNKSNNNINIPYKSVLVVPISKTEDQEHIIKMIGFLTFDSIDQDAFDEVTVSIAKKTSTLIFDLLNQLSDLLENPSLDNQDYKIA